jgi:alanyl-tRNA synthetase
MQTGEAARKVNERLSAAEYRCAGLERKLWDNVAADYAGRGDVLHFEDGLTPLAVRELADRIAEKCGGTAAVFCGTDGNFNLCLVNKSGDVKDLGNAMKAALNARGGGKPGIFQGTAPATRTQIETFFRNWSVR